MKRKLLVTKLFLLAYPIYLLSNEVAYSVQETDSVLEPFPQDYFPTELDKIDLDISVGVELAIANNVRIKYEELKQSKRLKSNSYWALEGLKDKKSKFAKSMKNLEKLVTYSICANAEQAEKTEENFKKAIVDILTLITNNPKLYDNEYNRECVCGLMNGWIIFNTLFDVVKNIFIYARDHQVDHVFEGISLHTILFDNDKSQKQKIENQDLTKEEIEKWYNEYFKKIYIGDNTVNTRSIKRLLYSALSEKDSSQKLIDKYEEISGSNNDDYKLYKHDWDCYLRQFNVIIDGFDTYFKSQNTVDSKNKERWVTINDGDNAVAQINGFSTINKGNKVNKDSNLDSNSKQFVGELPKDANLDSNSKQFVGELPDEVKSDIRKCDRTVFDKATRRALSVKNGDCVYDYNNNDRWSQAFGKNLSCVKTILHKVHEKTFFAEYQLNDDLHKLIFKSNKYESPEQKAIKLLQDIEKRIYYNNSTLAEKKISDKKYDKHEKINTKTNGNLNPPAEVKSKNTKLRKINQSNNFKDKLGLTIEQYKTVIQEFSEYQKLINEHNHKIAEINIYDENFFKTYFGARATAHHFYNYLQSQLGNLTYELISNCRVQANNAYAQLSASSLFHALLMMYDKNDSKLLNVLDYFKKNYYTNKQWRDGLLEKFQCDATNVQNQENNYYYSDGDKTYFNNLLSETINLFSNNQGNKVNSQACTLEQLDKFLTAMCLYYSKVKYPVPNSNIKMLTNYLIKKYNEKTESIYGQSYYDLMNNITKIETIKGFKNLGKTCYINAALQILLNIKEFCALLLSHEGTEVIKKSYCSAFINLRNLIVEYLDQLNEDEVIDPKPLILKMQNDFNKDLFDINTADASKDVLTTLLEQMNKELVKKTSKMMDTLQFNKNQMSAHNQLADLISFILDKEDEYIPIISNLFEGITRTDTLYNACDDCFKERQLDFENLCGYKYMSSNYIELAGADVYNWRKTNNIGNLQKSNKSNELKSNKRGSVSIYDCLDYKYNRYAPTSGNIISACNICQKFRYHKEYYRNQIVSLPKILILILDHGKDLTASVNYNFNEQLNLDKYVMTQRPEGWNYKLSSVIIHSGASGSSGHYMALIKNSKDWFLCSDTSVNKLNQAKINNGISKYCNEDSLKPMVLVYRLID